MGERIFLDVVENLFDGMEKYLTSWNLFLDVMVMFLDVMENFVLTSIFWTSWEKS